MTLKANQELIAQYKRKTNKHLMWLFGSAPLTIIAIFVDDAYWFSVPLELLGVVIQVGLLLWLVMTWLAARRVREIIWAIQLLADLEAPLSVANISRTAKIKESETKPAEVMSLEIIEELLARKVFANLQLNAQGTQLVAIECDEDDSASPEA